MRAIRRFLLVATMSLGLAGVAGCADDPPAAVVGITVTGCGTGAAHGTGTVLDGGLILTAAHVVKGAREITVSTRRSTTTAAIVAFDPDMDLALLRPETIGPHQLSLSADARSRLERGSPAHVYVFRDGSVVVLEGRVRRPIELLTEDIYIEGETRRPAFELQAEIEAGDSGGPVVVDGHVVGVVSLRSDQAADRAYAVDPVAAGAVIRERRVVGDLTRCT